MDDIIVANYAKTEWWGSTSDVEPVMLTEV